MATSLLHVYIRWYMVMTKQLLFLATSACELSRLICGFRNMFWHVQKLHEHVPLVTSKAKKLTKTQSLYVCGYKLTTCMRWYMVTTKQLLFLTLKCMCVKSCLICGFSLACSETWIRKVFVVCVEDSSSECV